MLNIHLGRACNFRCGYCLQNTDGSEDNTRPSVDGFIERVIPYVQARGIKEVAYWGGEPLLYWKQIEAIHQAFLDAGVSFDFVKLVTNGSLLTEAHVARLNQWNAFVVVSRHEGAGEPRWDRVARLKRSSVSFLFHHGSLIAWPWFEELAALEDRFGRPFRPYVHWLRATDGCGRSFDLTHDDLDRHVPHLWDLARARLRGHKHAASAWAGHLRDWRATLYSGASAIPLCHNDRHVSVDLMGNRYTCHHNVRPNARTGNIFSNSDSTTDAEQGALALSRRWVDSADCRVCPIRTWCRGNCHLSNTHDVDCRLAREKHKLLAWIDARETGPNDRNAIKVP
jgi:radical SAM protein with 4Fe4S-binding SPASM domain